MGKKLVSLVLGLCLSLNLFFPVVGLADEGRIGGQDFYGLLDEVAIYDRAIVVASENAMGYIGGTNYRGLIDELAIYGSVLPMSSQKGYIGGDNFYGLIDQVAIYDKVLAEDFKWVEEMIAIDLIPPNMGWNMSKLDSSFSFGVRLINLDPRFNPSTQKMNLLFYVDDVLVDDIEVTDWDGKPVSAYNNSFDAEQGKRYRVTINDMEQYFFDGALNSFRLKAIAKDLNNTVGEEVVVSFIYHSADIIAHWPLDTIKDGLTIDVSGSGNHGQVQGARLVTGVSGNGMRFRGNDCIRVLLAPGIDITTTDFSLEAWVKPEGNNGLLVGNPGGNMGPHWMLMMEQERLGVSVNSGGGAKVIRTAGVVEKNRWHHVIAVRDGNELRFYVDGQVIGNMSGVSGNVNSGKDVYLGESFEGCLDEVRIYGRALSEEEILNNYRGAIFVNDFKMINKYLSDFGEQSHPCNFGVHEAYLEFSLQKDVEELVITLDLPSSIKLQDVGNVFKKEGSNYVDKGNVTATVDELIFGKLVKGDYRVELRLNIDEHLVVKAKTYQDERGIKINCDQEIFWFEFWDLGKMPQLK